MPHLPLTVEPSYYEERAAGLQSALLDGYPELIEQVRQFLPGLATTPSVDDCLQVLAAEHGFSQWQQLQRHLAELATGNVEEPFIDAFAAIRQKDLSALSALLQRHPGLSLALGTNGNTLLSLAASLQDLDSSKLLLTAGADPNQGNRYGWTPVHQSGYSNQVGLAELLLDAGGDVTLSARGDGGTPLVVALFWGHREVAELLGARQAAPRNLRVAAGLGRTDMFPDFFDSTGSLLPAAGRHRAFYRPHGGFPHWKPSDDAAEVLNEALTYAARNGRINAIELLLQYGADVNADPYRGTALMWACWTGQLHAAECLVDHGADVNQRATFGGPSHGQGVTALHLAAQNGRSDAVELLLSRGADATITDDLYQSTAAG